MGIRDFIGIIRELSFESIRDETRIAPRMLVIGRDRATVERLRLDLLGLDGEHYSEAHTFDDVDVDPLHYDVIVTLGPLTAATARSWDKIFRRVHEPMRLVEVNASRWSDQRSLESVRRRIAEAADERTLAIGRYIPIMQEVCARQIVADTARVNGQFALVSNIPALVPVVGNVIAVGADSLVLTKNQLMMMYKLAAIFGRDLDNRWRIYSELMPVVGLGLVWRTVARELAALMPFAIGTVPKVAIAFAGTWATGQAAYVYYERGETLNREQMRVLYAEGLRLLKENPIRAAVVRRNGKEEALSRSPERALPPITDVSNETRP